MHKEQLQAGQQGSSESGEGKSKNKNTPIGELPVEELTHRINDSHDLATMIDATHELVRRLEES
jgi:hypothetical protein